MSTQLLEEVRKLKDRIEVLEESAKAPVPDTEIPGQLALF